MNLLIYQKRTELFFISYMNNICSTPKLQEAMTYAMLNGGKRIRPALVYITGQIFNAPAENLDIAACAIELIHAYSLVHDDLPAMDNANLRRGKPSCHKAFDEATAILAGDALQTLAFDIIASHPGPLHAEQRIQMIKILSHASGLHGMAAGQILDLEGAHSIESLTHMYQLKTGALLNASTQLGATAANIQDPIILDAIETYTKNIGLAFQIQDDLLDSESSHITGKPQCLDNINQKNTYPIFMGIEQTQKTLETLYNNAYVAIKCLGDKASTLVDFANFLLQRKK